MSAHIGNPVEHIVDGENNNVEFDIAYPVRGNLIAAIGRIYQLHGEEIYLLPMSGTSTGGGIFQAPVKAGATVVGLKFDPPSSPRLRFASQPALADIDLDEIVIDPDHRQVCAGASITLHQLNQALVNELGHSYKVPGADLTSYMYAAVGATFMTGGMGPQRRYFSDSVIEISLFDGKALQKVENEALQGYAGTYGWSGIVTALRCDYYRFPDNEIAFALPLSSKSDQLAALLDHLSPYCYLDLGQARVASADQRPGLILGIEHVSLGSMQPLLNPAIDNPAQKRATELQQKCVAAEADGLVFINGFSDCDSDEFLIGLSDNPLAEEYTIAGIGLEFAEVFNAPEEMRAVREAIPYVARTQAPGGKRVYKNHSDANIRLPQDNVKAVVKQLWEINQAYVTSIEEHFTDSPGVKGQILVYGHLNPYGIDPHNRVTMGSDDDEAFLLSRQFLVEQRAHYYRSLATLCDTTGAVFIGGEKTADSEMAIYRALGGPEQAPSALFDRFRQQRATIAAAAAVFNWRTPEPYSPANAGHE